jgi:hypothetical protein
LSRPPSALFLFADFLRAGFAIWTPVMSAGSEALYAYHP